ncbi:invasin domain [Chlorella sorokiniana]|uniref:Invasin domain n=1 Tax=Chlorella sorokiniana TaxID=3076 RepID=A0A2P6TSN4_CHLSO|nr:invasin domain [Chlorella sorokiniana]|eukprot:PRW57077.1 invasin domain [Chlorella sorokiniana]
MQLSLGLLLPALLAAYTWRPAAAADGSPDILAMPRVAHLQHLAAPHIAFLRTLRNSVASNLSKGTMAADATVHALLSSSNQLSSRALTAYWVLSLCWVLCKRLAGIYAIC